MNYLYNNQKFTLTTKEGEKYKLKITTDSDAESPRDWDNVAKMVCYSTRKYTLGDEQKEHFWLFDDLAYELGIEIPEEREEDRQWVAETVLGHDNIVIFPLFMYDHGGITMRCGDPGCTWDSFDTSCVGYIYITRDIMDRVYVGNDWKEKAKDICKAEVKTYSQYLEGRVFAFELVKEIKCECCGTIREEVIDNCAGFYGDTLEDSGILDNLPIDVASIDED